MTLDGASCALHTSRDHDCSKAWQLRTISSRLSESGVGPEVLDALRTSADEHYGAASWRAADYVGSHWLHSFALLALDPE